MFGSAVIANLFLQQTLDGLLKDHAVAVFYALTTH